MTLAVIVAFVVASALVVADVHAGKQRAQW
jgi:hypothetical protein